METTRSGSYAAFRIARLTVNGLRGQHGQRARLSVAVVRQFDIENVTARTHNTEERFARENTLKSENVFCAPARVFLHIYLCEFVKKNFCVI